MPFYRKSKKNLFFHGHIAIGLNEFVYQIYNPKLLHSNFFVSKMPIKHWLFKDGKFFDNKKDSSTYRHVHLYRKAESKKTIVYYAGTSLKKSKIKLFQDYFEDQEKKYQLGEIYFNIFNKNCATEINTILYIQKWLKKNIFDFIPAILFKRLIQSWKNKNISFNFGKISGKTIESSFQLHKLCIGIPSLNPEKHLDNYLHNITSLSSIKEVIF